jgi:hypothetical protein
MIEGIPAFFAAGQYGLWLLIIMALVFAAATISVYIVFSVYSAKGLKLAGLSDMAKSSAVRSSRWLVQSFGSGQSPRPPQSNCTTTQIADHLTE